MFKEYEMSLLSERQAPLFESGSFLSQSIPYLKIRFEPLPRGSTNLKSLKQSISYAKPPSSIGAGTAKVQLVDLLFKFFFPRVRILPRTLLRCSSRPLFSSIFVL